MKKTASFLIAILFVFLFASCKDVSDKENTAPVDAGQSAVVHAPSDTKIFNDFAAQLPDFKFSNPIIENYDESISYVFSVKSNIDEFDAYVEALKNAGFVSGTEGAPVSGQGYYKATNSEKYLVDVVLVDNSELTVIVTRP